MQYMVGIGVTSCPRFEAHASGTHRPVPTLALRDGYRLPSRYHNRARRSSSWPGPLSRQSTSLAHCAKQAVDARDERGHDELDGPPLSRWSDL